MDDPTFKQKYQKYKLRVKIWEKDFKLKHSRVPSKYDIREAPQEIRDAYKMYYKLKTSFLENTLNDVLTEDGFDVLEISQTESEYATDIVQGDGNTACINGGPQLPLDIVSIVQGKSSTSTDMAKFSNLQELRTTNVHTSVVNVDEKHAMKHFEAVEELEGNVKAWGSEVSYCVESSGQSDEVVTTSGELKKPFTSNLSRKLFKTASFSKRNPRKSLSRTNSETSGSMSDVSSLGEILRKQREVLPDLETILVQKAKEQQALTAICINPLLEGSKSKETVKTQVDEGWLRRTTAQDGISLGDVRKPKDTDKATTNKLSYGLSNINVTKLVAKETSTPTKAITSMEKCAMYNEIEDNDLVHRQLVDIKAAGGDSDSVVSDSGEEDVEKTYRHCAKRRKIITIDRNEPGMVVKNENKVTQLESDKQLQNLHDEYSAVAEDEKDFSADDDRDVDFVPENIKVNHKRDKKVNTSTVKLGKPTRRKKSPNSKIANKKSTNCTRRSRNGELEVKPDEEVEEKPPEPTDLKYALLLEQSDIACVPRANLQELEIADDAVQRYINTRSTLGSKLAADTHTDQKRIAARKRLESKIAAGKLNENYVTINIQKKVYTRGKKNINYSRYKKQQWKHKKRVAALTGPEMDMGGCDGGVLKCFTCGKVGHFAVNCNVKGDSLLPLTAQLEEDPSPFPTLEEAEHMAAQSAVAVHSRNITSLPAASNSALYSIADNAMNSDGESIDIDFKGVEDDELLIDTDEEFENLDLKTVSQMSPIKSYVGHKIPADFLKQAGLDRQNMSLIGGAGALYDLNPDGSVKEPTAEVYEALHLFGHSSFRKGQERAIMRVLSGLSTLVTLSTGSGKSLCYQLPAYLYSRQMKSITLVISPLVSLMEDQVTGVPHFLRAHCLHTNQSPQQRFKVLEMIRSGEVDILLVSPEAVVAGERSNGFGSILRQLPPIAFACIDEVHCVSQWSHNFRPSYLMICKVLRKNLGVRTVLGLTATATLPTRLSIIDHLGIADGERGIISDTPLPDNLVLSVSKDENKDTALMTLLSSKRFSHCQSIIIYCTRRDECERVASYLRTCLQDHNFAEEQPKGTQRKRKRMNWAAEPYHAGMPSSRRRTVQNAFMRNELRIVVATIAFGMGINKPDIRAVIHYNMPRNFESYVQEIGRAGRDGKLAHCHLFLDARGNDQFELRRHIYANSIDRHVIRKLLQRVFVSCACEKNVKNLSLRKQNANVAKNEERSEASIGDAIAEKKARKHICQGHEIGFSIEQTVEALDIPEENVATLLCYLELDQRWGINVLSSAYTMAKVISYGGAKYLKHAAKECPPLAMAIALEINKNNFKEDANIIEFSVVDIASAIGWNSGIVKYQLKNLEWVQVNGYPKRSPINVNFHDLGFRLKAPGDFTIEEIDDALDTLYKRSVRQEQTQLIQLQYVFQGLSSVAYNTCGPCTSDNFSLTRSDQLKGIIRDYFQNDYPKDLKLEITCDSVATDCIENDVNAIINMYPDNNFSGRSIARIFYGISSPNYPAVMWGRCKFWRAHSKVDFNQIVQLANAVIVKRRT